MGGIAEIQESIRNQFISLFDSVLFIAEHGKGTHEQAFKLLKAKLLNKQIYLFLIDEFSLVEIALFQDDYEAVEYDGQYITINFICSELEKSIANNAPTSEIKSYGFGLKRFYETLQNDLKITISPFISSKALSPDCYHDNENPLTPVVKELQAENERLKTQYDAMTANYHLNKIRNMLDDKDKEDLERLRKEVRKLNEQNYYLEHDREYFTQKCNKLEQQITLKHSFDSQLASQPTAEPINKPVKEGQGDSLLILGAVMETMAKIKPHYTQESHITAILDNYKNVTGISKSTLNKKFTEAKNYLKQSLN